MLELDMIENGAGNRLDVGAAGPDVFLQMPRPKAVDQISQAVEHQNPGKQEMPMAGVGQVLEAGNGQP